MKKINLSVLFIVLFIQCSKNQTVHNDNLYTMPLSQIKEQIKGTWRVSQYCYITIAGMKCDSPTNDSITFFPNDSIKWVKNGAIYINQKITFERIKSPDGYDYGEDSLYIFNIPSINAQYWPYKINNDTLEITTPFFNIDAGFSIYLTK